MTTFVTVDDLVDFKKGKKPPELFDKPTNRTKPFYQIDELRGSSSLKYANYPSGTEVNEHDVCIVWDGANAGTVGYGLNGLIGSTIARMRLKKPSTVYTPYLGRFLQSNFTVLNSGSQGAAIPHVDGNRLKSMGLVLPSIGEQQRIAAILDKADAIRRKRQQAIQLADEFLRSVFLDMFGDPVSNPKRWPNKHLSSLGELARGKSKHRPRNDPALLGGPYPLIQTGDVANASHYIRSYSQTYSEAGLRQSKLWPAGTLCITIAANIADTAILAFDACFPDSVVGFTPGPLVRTEYIHMWLRFRQSFLKARAPESAQKNINLEILSALEIPTPAIDLQDKFVRLFHAIEDAKEKMRKSEAECSGLYGSASQRAFRGEL